MKKSLALLVVLGALQVACSTDAPKSQNTDTTKSSTTQIKASNDIEQPQATTDNYRNLDYIQSPEFQEMVAKIKTRLQKEEKEVFEQFAFLGLSQCFDMTLPYSGSMGNMYANGFNAGSEIFPRLIAFDDLEKELKDFHEKNFPKQDYYSFF